MMRKTVARLLALVLVLCMVVMCVPLRAHAEVNLTRPENITDEEWEVLRQKLLAQLAAEQAAATTPVTPETLPETDSLSKSDSGNLTVTDTAKTPGGTDTNQTVSVELPPQADTITTTTDGDKTPITNEYDTTIAVNGEEKNVTVEESYDLNATVKETETVGDGENKEVTDITYDVSLNGSVSATDKKDSSDVVKSDVVNDIDAVANEAAKEAKITAPQYKVNMSVTGMKADPTRITHTKKPTTTPPDAGEPAETEEPEYFYNAANGTEDTTKKYFTVEERVVSEVKDEKGNVVNIVKEKVVSLWTSFLGIFHITNDAFEGADKTTYGSLTEAAAVDANTGKTVEMLRDYETTSTATISNGVTVDLNGNSYTNTGSGAAITSSGNGVTVENGKIYSGGDGVDVTGGKFSLKNIFLKSNAKDTNTGITAGIKANDGASSVTVEDSFIDGTNSRYGIQYTGDPNKKSTLTVRDSDVVGGTGIAIKDASAKISGSYVAGTAKAVKGTDSGAAVSVEQNGTNNSVDIISGLFDSAREVENIYATGKNAINSITVKGGRFTDPDDLYCYVAPAHAVISHNDGSYFLYEVVGTDYVPSRDGYRFLGYTDGNGNAISLAEAYRKGVIAYAQWKEIPEKTAKPLTVADLIKVKTDEKDCTIKVTVKGDTAFVTVKDKDGDFAPISEVKAISVKKLQLLKIDTIEVQVDEDVSLVLDIEKAKENGFADTIEVNLEKDTLLITSGEDTCIELDIAVLKASDKPVEIQLVEGELSVQLGKNSTMSVDLTKALKTGERIVVKLENGVLKLYDKYNKPIKE